MHRVKPQDMTLFFSEVTRALTRNKHHITSRITLSFNLYVLSTLKTQFTHVTTHARAIQSKYDRLGTTP